MRTPKALLLEFLEKSRLAGSWTSGDHDEIVVHDHLTKFRKGATTREARSNLPRSSSWPARSRIVSEVRAGGKRRAVRISSGDPKVSFVPCTNMAGVRSWGKCAVLHLSGWLGGWSG